jgi:GMP synthase-like glutamine amidotransferase
MGTIQNHRLHYIQHVPFEGLGSIAEWAQRHTVEVSRTRIYAGEQLPPPEDYDWLMVLGGPMAVHDVEAYPWLNTELKYIDAAIQTGTRVIGICLGAQMLAHILGAEVRANPFKEIGWFPVSRAKEADTTEIGSVFGDDVMAFHWHGQTFDIPHGATHLASSAACTNQAFVYDDRILALQYHLETTREAARKLIEHSQDEMTPGPYVQSPDSIMAAPDRFTAINTHMSRLLDLLM